MRKLQTLFTAFVMFLVLISFSAGAEEYSNPAEHRFHLVLEPVRDIRIFSDSCSNLSADSGYTETILQKSHVDKQLKLVLELDLASTANVSGETCIVDISMCSVPYEGEIPASKLPGNGGVEAASVPYRSRRRGTASPLTEDPES